jgi:MOSC domain-containing protein YiiM
MDASTRQDFEVGPVGSVVGLAVRPGMNKPMCVLDQIVVTVEDAVVEDYGKSLKRGITLLSSMQWQQVQDELGAELPWHLRRANVLIEAKSLVHLIGKTICIGDVQVAITTETDPCSLMETLHSGLEAALTPDCRGGVYGKVVKGGAIKIGDVVTLV